MIVKIYLRAIKQGDANCLALFDSNRQGDINNLTTDANVGDTVIWTLDCCSGIKSITNISPKEDSNNSVFLSAPRKRLFCTGYKLPIEKGAKGIEKYTIKCVLSDNTELPIDPYIRVPPPPPPKT
jgi:hypothetical protein